MPAALGYGTRQMKRLNGEENPFEYLNNLQPEVKRRIKALKFHDLKKEDLNKLYHEELSALRKKYIKLRQPILSEMAAIIQGQREPTEEETVLDDEEADSTRFEEVDSSAAKVKGVPDFWLHVLKNSPLIGDLITEADEAALKFLSNIEVSLLEPQGFKIDFFFDSNEFFTNQVLSKSYFFSESAEEADDTEFQGGRSEGTLISWKEKKNLTVKLETKTQKKKGTSQMRTVTKEVPCESFFHIFNPPVMPDEDDEVENEDELYEAIEADFQIGELLKNRIIPRALDCYLGELSDFGEDEGCYDEDCEDCDDHDDSEEEDEQPRMKEEIDEDGDEAPAKPSHPTSKKAGHKQQVEYDSSACKQQ